MPQLRGKSSQISKIPPTNLCFPFISIFKISTLDPHHLNQSPAQPGISVYLLHPRQNQSKVQLPADNSLHKVKSDLLPLFCQCILVASSLVDFLWTLLDFGKQWPRVHRRQNALHPTPSLWRRATPCYCTINNLKISSRQHSQDADLIYSLGGLKVDI